MNRPSNPNVPALSDNKVKLSRRRDEITHYPQWTDIVYHPGGAHELWCEVTIANDLIWIIELDVSGFHIGYIEPKYDNWLDDYTSICEKHSNQTDITALYHQWKTRLQEMLVLQVL